MTQKPKRALLLFFVCVTNLKAFAGFPNQPMPPPDRLDNWGVIQGNQIYRSKKLSTEVLHNRVLKHKIRSILCLSSCTDEERAYAKISNINYFYQPMSMTEISQDELEKVVQTLKTAPKPLLIHCRAGADRTGLAAALYFYEIEKKSIEVSRRKGLRFKYNHLGRLFNPEIHEAFDLYTLNHK